MTKIQMSRSWVHGCLCYYSLSFHLTFYQIIKKKSHFLAPLMVDSLQTGSALSSVFGFPHRDWFIANNHLLGRSFGPFELRKVPPKILQLLVWRGVSLGTRQEDLVPPTAAVSPLVIEAGGVRKLPSPCLKLWEEEGNASDQCSEKAGRPQESPRQSAGKEHCQFQLPRCCCPFFLISLLETEKVCDLGVTWPRFNWLCW